MSVVVRFTPAELSPGELAERVVVVVDVLRATSTIVEALAAGARGVLPVATPEEAVRVATGVGRDAALLCGERGGRPIEGFDLGNSPLEFTPEKVKGRLLVMTTTNGTGALLACSGADRVLVGSFLNLEATAAEAARDGRPVTIVCAGRQGRFALEDALLAGLLVTRVRATRGEPLRSDDGGRAATALARRYRRRIAAVVKASAAGLHLAAIGYARDVAHCVGIDRRAVVPELRERRVTLPGQRARAGTGARKGSNAV